MEEGHSMSLLDHMVKSRLLFLLIASVGVAILVVNLEGQETAVLAGNLLYVPVTFFMVISSYVLLRKQRKIGDRDKGWVLFFGSTIAWLVAEHVWMITELVYHEKPFPSAADFFYIIGYILMGVFIFKMLWPLKNYISLNIKLFATLVTVVFLVPTVFVSYGGGSEDFLSLILSLAYPVMDAILLWPGIIVLSSSSKLKSGKFWSLVSVGIISLLIGDTIFSYASLLETYYTGYPFEMFFYAAYLIFGYAALVRTRQALAHAPLIEEVKEAFRESAGKSIIVTWKVLLILSVSIIITFLILILEKDVVQNLSTRELEVVTPVGYLVSGLIIISIVITLLSVKKIHSLQLKVKQLQYFPDKEIGSVDRDNTIIGLQQLIDKIEMRRNAMIPFWVGLVVVLVVVSTYAITSTINEIEQSNAVIQSSSYIIENLQGSTIDTWATWNKSPGESLHVTIVNSNLVSDSKIQAIKDAILSKETIIIKNLQSGQNSSDVNSVYYKGWEGALEKVSQQNSSTPVPTVFDITQSDKAVGDIVIILSTNLEGDGALGFTKSIADMEHHQLLKSFITIFDVKDLSDRDLGDITRHEFGHALGLGHSSDPEDLMNDKFHADRAYISPCDLDALASLYGGNGSKQIQCVP